MSDSLPDDLRSAIARLPGTKRVRDSPRVETATQALHRLTSYEPGREWDEPVDDARVLQDLVANDMTRRTWFYKRYPEHLELRPLPRDLPFLDVATMPLLAGSASCSRLPLDLSQLARLLHLSAGVVRTGERLYGRYLFRAAGSAGARFPLELYVAVPEGGELPAGVHWYHPEEHALVEIGPPPSGTAPAIIVSGVPWRTGWRYRERGFRHVYWDAGTMLSQLLALADSAGLDPALLSRFPDAQISELIGADRVHEWPVAIVSLGRGSPAIHPAGPSAAGEIDASPVEFPLVTEAQRAGERELLGAPWPEGPVRKVDGSETRPLDEVILTRGSLRLMDPQRSLPAETLQMSMDVAMRGIAIPHFVVVHAVEGISPGVYRWPDLSAPVRVGDLRDELYRVALEQGLARDAAFVVIGAEKISELDDREYRDAQLAAGLVEGRLHLAAYALGAGASGMTFLDSEIPQLLQGPWDALLFTCVGVPEYRSTPGGQPGAPRSIVTPEPRL